MTSTSATVETRITDLLKTFKLPTVAEEVVPRFRQGGQDQALVHLLEVLELEAQDRRDRRTVRLRRSAGLPPGKTFDTLDETRFPRPLVRLWRELAAGEFLERATNVLAFGKPGVGKSHVASALGHALIEAGHSVLFTPTFALVQQLQAAKRALDLPRLLRKLDYFELLILDDLGYIRQSPEDAEVLFTLLAERYERRSVMLTSNLLFSQWDRIFQNEMTTAAAIDRLVHHSVVLEFNLDSYRGEVAEKAKKSRTKSKEKQ
jgi:DNA replication protein DnaC